MDKLTAIKIKYNDGTYSDEIPISALAENVEWNNSYSLVDILGEVAYDTKGSIQDQISQLFNEKINISTMQDYINNTMPSYITSWLNENVDPVGSAVVVDNSLTISGAAADARVVGDKITNLNNSLIPFNCTNILKFVNIPTTSNTRGGLTYTPNSDGSISISGEKTGSSWMNDFWNNTAAEWPENWEKGQTYYYYAQGSNYSTLRVYKYNSTGGIDLIADLHDGDSFTIPDSITSGGIIRLGVWNTATGTTINEEFIPFLLSVPFTDVEITQIIKNFSNINLIPSSILNHSTRTVKGLTFSWDKYNQIHVLGTGTGLGWTEFFSSNLPDNLLIGKQYNVNYIKNNEDDKIILKIYSIDSSNTHTLIYSSDNLSNLMFIPINTVKLSVRLWFNTTSNIDTIIKEISVTPIENSFIHSLSNQYWSFSGISSCDDVEDNLITFTTTDSQSGIIPSDFPYERAGMLFTICQPKSVIKYQFAVPYYDQLYNIKIRVKNTSGVWSEWRKMPIIQTTSDIYLASTGDTTDRSAEITALLQANKVCKLGVGDYYIKTGINMPNNSSIIGCGRGTRLILDSTVQDGFVISAGSYCTIQDLWIAGSLSNLPYEDREIGTRHGIILIGDATGFDGQSTFTHNFAQLSNLFITNFTGSGIKAYRNDGAASFLAENIDILYCGIGINIELFSEFHAFTNIRCRFCVLACQMNGGNNLFSNCHFDACINLLRMDNSSNNLINDSHSSFTNCTFCHANHNNGNAIELYNIKQGLMFSNCQIFYSKIIIEDSAGIVITNFNIGHSQQIIISNSSAINISNCIFGGTPTIQRENVTGFIYENNMLKDGTLLTL